nr:hypothetical protein [Mucilaginibacter sp. SP1R1]
MNFPYKQKDNRIHISQVNYIMLEGKFIAVVASDISYWRL